MLVTVVPEIPPASDRVVRYESAVTVHRARGVEGSAAALAVLSVLIAPVSVELFWSVAVIELMLSATMSPVRVWPSAVSIAVPPLEPLVPQLPARRLHQRAGRGGTVTPLSVMTPVELVT